MIVSDGSMIRCVGAVVHATSGRLLLVKRANDPGRGRWSVPGGRVRSGEDDRAAVRREVREETGISVRVGPLVGRVVRPAQHGTYEVFDYACWSNETVLSPGDDAADAAWVNTAIFTTLQRENQLTDGLADALREWDCLPRDG